jgi:acyl-coenzyme A thioesterase PaaI-like protein
MRCNLGASRVQWHSQCVACGNRNGQGLRLEFCVREARYVETSFGCEAAFEGFPGFLHGGIIATLLDAAMTNCLFAHGIVGLTAELKVRYLHPVSIGKAARVYAWLERSVHRLHGIRSELEQDGVIKAAASGRFLETNMAFGRDGPAGAQAVGTGPQK